MDLEEQVKTIVATISNHNIDIDPDTYQYIQKQIVKQAETDTCYPPKKLYIDYRILGPTDRDKLVNELGVIGYKAYFHGSQLVLNYAKPKYACSRSIPGIMVGGEALQYYIDTLAKRRKIQQNKLLESLKNSSNLVYKDNRCSKYRIEDISDLITKSYVKSVVREMRRYNTVKYSYKNGCLKLSIVH